MPRILVGNEWYEELSPASLYEAEFETILMQQAHLIYPHHFLVPFKKVVRSEYGSAKPDLALIEKLYREWWVIEVELSHHSLNHVLRQVEIFTRAYYGIEESEYLRTKSQELDSQALRDLMKGKQPQVMVMVNKPRPQWIKELQKYEASLSIMEMFRSERNHHIFRINGDRPQPDSSVLSGCRVHELLRNTLILDSPAALGVQAKETVIIRYQDTLTQWRRMDIKDSVWLVFIGRDNPLEARRKYMLIRDEDDQLVIQVES